MGVFSTMSEDEIKKRQIEQDARQREQDRREADLARQAAGVESDETRLAGAWNELIAERAKSKKELFEAEQVLAAREAEARNGFVAQQREAFREAIEVRSIELDARLREITELKARVSESLEALAVDQAVLAARELAVKEREQQAEVEFPAVTRKVLAGVEVREASCVERERGLDQRDAEARERHAALERRADQLRRREEEVARAEAERDAGFAEQRRSLDEELRGQRQELADRAEELRRREALVALAEEVRDRGFTELRRDVELELHARRQSAEEELGPLRMERLAELQREVEHERRQRRDDLQRELDAERAATATQLEARRAAFEVERARTETALLATQAQADQQKAIQTAKERELDYRKKALDEWEGRLETRKQSLEAEVEQRVVLRQRVLDTKEAAFAERVSAHEEDVAEATAERKASYDKREVALMAELNRLRGQLQSADRLFGAFEALKRQLGGRDAEQVVAELAVHEVALRDLREQLAAQTPAMRGEFERVRMERDDLQTRLDKEVATAERLHTSLQGENVVRRDLMAAEDRAKSLATKVDVLEGTCLTLEEENRRLRAVYARESDRDARIADIEKSDPTEKRDVPRLSSEPASRENKQIEENEWLQGISRACADYGLQFHPRILKAFHTALKTAEWSPLTVLAGISGTGKSELPKLYAHFGGMTFKSLSVQPNWDSQESMLGFFNSIDNKFDAQPVLRLLARSQKPWSADFGLADHLVMILLDEMNLAHPELYFAEFLSKLELRRGCKGVDVPALEVKLGAGLLPYKVPMGRNVLWMGTMNQDETTKALSDKVLDRSIIINFPRPATLERRRELKQLPPAAPLLPRRVWESWWARKSELSEDDIRPFKTIIEGINGAMSRVGRALGHRVWQSVEYYMANYPDTRAAQRDGSQPGLEMAMRTAFEDQLVQKVMPKLRGIDTRGRGQTDCLDKVRDLLAENGYDDLLADFHLSCEFGYGQFIWQTVNFLQPPPASERSIADGVPVVTTIAPADATTTAPAARPAEGPPKMELASDDVPSTFMPGDPDRANKWRRLSGGKKQKYLDGDSGKVP